MLCGIFFLSFEPAITRSVLFTFGGWSHKTTNSCHTRRVSAIQVGCLLMCSQLACLPEAVPVTDCKTHMIKSEFIFDHLICV